MFFPELGQIIKFAVQSIFRNVWLSVVTVTIIVLALFSISSLLMFNMLTKHTLAVVENKTDVYIDLTADATAEQADSLVTQLKNLPAIKEVVLLTPDQTLQNFKDRHQNDALILKSLEALESNPFRGSLKINVNNISDFPSILTELSKEQYAKYLEIEDKEFTDAKILISGISDYAAKIERAGLIISLVFILIALMVVFNTIQVGIYTHREEIGIMKLVGASNGFVRSPFLIEGIIYSFVSVFILAIILFPLLSLAQPYVDAFFKEYSANLVDLLKSNFFSFFGMQLLIAIFITVASGFVAVRRYLKV